MPIRRRRFALGLLAACTALAMAGSDRAAAMDVGAYKKLLEDTVKEITGGTLANAEATKSRLDQAMKLAADGAREYLQKDSTHRRMFDALLGGLDEMKRSSADKIEDDWGEDGKQFGANGFDLKKNDQFTAAKSFADIIVHPALVYALIGEFQKSKDKSLLDRAKAELVEAIEHTEHLK